MVKKLVTKYPGQKDFDFSGFGDPPAILEDYTFNVPKNLTLNILFAV